MKPLHENLFNLLIGRRTYSRYVLNDFLYYFDPYIRHPVCDLAAGSGSSYHRILSNYSAYSQFDYQPTPSQHYFDFNNISCSALLPSSFNTIFLINAIYMCRDLDALFSHLFTSLKPGGVLIVSNPFIFSINPEPVDVARYTPAYIKECLTTSGFEIISIRNYGGRFVAAYSLLSPYLKFFAFLLVPMSLFFDQLFSRTFSASNCPTYSIIVALKP